MSKLYTTDIFIEKARLVHGNKYDYSLVNYENSNERVIIICCIHGTFKQRPADHLMGCGCPICNHKGNPKLTTEQFIEKANIKHSNRYDYSKVQYTTTHDPIIIVCKKCKNEFKKKPVDHLCGTGCPHCRMSKGELLIEDYLTKNNIAYETQKTFSDCIGKKNRRLRFDFYLPKYNVCMEFDGEQHFDDSRSWEQVYATDVVFDTMRRDKIKTDYCKENNITLLRICAFQITDITNILNDYFINKKIPDNKSLLIIHNKKVTIEKFIEKANIKHSNKYSYEKVDIIDMFTDVMIGCPLHGDFYQVPYNHLRGSNCPKCARESAVKNTRMSYDEFVNRSVEIHGNKYDYSKVIYKNQFIDVIIGCREHGDFLQIPVVHIRQKSGCPKCSAIRVAYKIAEVFKMGKDEFVRRSKEIYGDKYDYSKVIYKNVKTPVVLICGKHGEFNIRPDKHLYKKQECKQCKRVESAVRESNPHNFRRIAKCQ